MSKTALLADVHGNLTALEAVLRDARNAGADKVFFLGDIMGFGPQPMECLLLLARECDQANMVIGNHDHMCCNSKETTRYNPYAREAIQWERTLLGRTQVPTRAGPKAALPWLSMLQEKFETPHGLFVHGSPRDPFREWIFSNEAQRCSDMENLFSKVRHLCFIGHTHIPGVLEHKPDRWIAPADVSMKYNITDRQAIINVGAVGQPRDEDPRACYALFDGESVEWRRVEYDIEAVIARINMTPQLDPLNGIRLRSGG